MGAVAWLSQVSDAAEVLARLLTGIKSHVLRYWESEFGVFRPVKSRSNQRLYRRQDIELVLRLKDLLYRQGFTIAGARQQLRDHSAGDATQQSLPYGADCSGVTALLDEIREDLTRLGDSLKTPPR
mgnify:CR=1 FL=1